MDKFFNEKGQFLNVEFLATFLESVEKAVDAIFEKNGFPVGFTRVLTNKNLRKTKCKECRSLMRNSWRTQVPFMPCNSKDCIVTVSQTKMGVCLQLLDHDDSVPVYISFDVIPLFKIEPIKSLTLARSVNRGMLNKGHPPGWYKYISDYVRCYKVVADIVDKENENMSFVTLKFLTAKSDKNFFVCPAQVIGKKFRSDGLKKMYCCIKALVKVLDLKDVKAFVIKKQMMKDVFLNLDEQTERSWGDLDEAKLLFKVLSQPELRSKFESTINFQTWESDPFNMEIPLLNK